MTSTPNLMELKECLQEAGMYEENMNEDEMRSYYNAIKSSENTAKEEDEQRNNETTDVFEMEDTAQDVGEMVVDEEKKSNDEITDDNQESESILDPLDCSPMEHRLTILYHTPRYNLPPHIDPKLKKLSVEARAKIISAFHYGLLQKFYDLHKQSKILAPWGSPIYLGESSKRWLDHKANSTYDVANIEQESEYPQEVYTSRSGRQTKRKVYAEEIDSDSEKKRTKKNDAEKDYKPVSKRMNATKLSNQEIMKRSKLFKESPKSSRNESMFDQMVTSEKKRQQEEEKIESFKKSLPNTEEDDDDDIIALSQSPAVVDDAIYVEVKELPVIRRRVPPPLHGRRGIGPKRTNAVALSEIDKVKASENSPKQTPQRSIKTDPKIPHTSTSSDNKEKNVKEMTKCPICSDFFHRDEVEAHASNCGLGMDVPLPYESPSDKSSKQLQCGICDKQFAMNTGYEIHVADCMRKERMK